MDCLAASALVPGYLDGELSESQASPLRQHLLECAACRSITQEGKTLQSWLVAESAIVVPPGFAQRVARRAFAGDQGRTEWSTASPARPFEARLRSYVVGLTALAAAVLMVVALVLGAGRRPQTSELRADDLSREAVLERLDELNRAEEAQAAPQPDPAGNDPERARK